MKSIVIAMLIAIAALIAAGPVIRPLPPTKSQFEASEKNLKAILLAFHEHADDNNKRLPNNLYARDGKPLLSWRVALLPYLKQRKLYEEFKLKEPWDSEHNRKLIAKMPKVYSPIRVQGRDGETYYRTFLDHGLFGLSAKYDIATIPDGSSNTAFVWEAGEPVIWTKPEGLQYEPTGPLPKLGGMFDGVCQVAVGDGSVFRLVKNPDRTHIERLIDPDDGLVVNFELLTTGIPQSPP